jgi:hypothetical protein
MKIAYRNTSVGYFATTIQNFDEITFSLSSQPGQQPEQQPGQQREQRRKTFSSAQQGPEQGPEPELLPSFCSRQ